MTQVYETPFCIRDWNISNFPSSHIFGVGQNFETQIMAAICFSSFHPAFSSYRQISTLLSINYTNPGATLGILSISWIFSDMYNLHEIFIFMDLAVVWLIRVVLDSRDSIILDNCQGLSYFPPQIIIHIGDESLGMWGKYQAVKKLFAWILRTKHQFMSEAEVRITKCLAVISIEGRFTVGTSIQKREINSFHHSASKWMRKPRWPLTIGLFLPRFPCTPPLPYIIYPSLSIIISF